MRFDSTKNKISDLVDEDIIVNIETDETTREDEDIKVLVRNTDLKSTDCVINRVSFEGESGDTYARTEFTIFDNVAIINWLEVFDPIRSNEVGRMLRLDVVNWIGDSYTQYSRIVNPNLIGVAIDQGFRQISDGSEMDNGEWFIRG